MRTGGMEVAHPQLRNGEGWVRPKEEAAHVAGAGGGDRHPRGPQTLELREAKVAAAKSMPPISKCRGDACACTLGSTWCVATLE